MRQVRRKESNKRVEASKFSNSPSNSGTRISLAMARKLKYKVAILWEQTAQENKPSYESKLIRDQRKLYALRDALLRLVEKAKAKQQRDDFNQLLSDTSQRLSHNKSIEFPQNSVSEIDFDLKPNLLVSGRNSHFWNSTDSFVPFNLKIKETM
jgi:hypothetical protein